MKAKRLTALALAALMAASTTSVALAIRVDDDLVFADDGYYKYNSDTNRIESVDREMTISPAMMFICVWIPRSLCPRSRHTMSMLTGLSAKAG